MGGGVDREAHERIQILKEQGVQRDHEIAKLSARISRVAADFAELAAIVHAIRVEVSTTAPVPSLPSPVLFSKPSTQPDSSPQVFPVMVVPPAPSDFASLIVSQFPPLFTEFGQGRFTLLWRGSRDRFRGRDFHRHCDGLANTLTLILDTAGNIFGGFTPVEWESGRHSKADPSLKSFLFTLKNPHNFPASKFALKAKRKDHALYCGSSMGPDFTDIGVSDNCNTNAGSYTSNFGDAYANDTGIAGFNFFTGSRNFTVKEIEVFEITE
jgi:hypothetical protein